MTSEEPKTLQDVAAICKQMADDNKRRREVMAQCDNRYSNVPTTDTEILAKCCHLLAEAVRNHILDRVIEADKLRNIIMTTNPPQP